MMGSGTGVDLRVPCREMEGVEEGVEGCCWSSQSREEMFIIAVDEDDSGGFFTTLRVADGDLGLLGSMMIKGGPRSGPSSAFLSSHATANRSLLNAPRGGTARASERGHKQ